MSKVKPVKTEQSKRFRKTRIAWTMAKWGFRAFVAYRALKKYRQQSQMANPKRSKKRS